MPERPSFLRFLCFSMNKHCWYVVGFFALTLVFPVRAQLLIGPVIDINLATITLEPTDGIDTSLRGAFGIGATLDYAINENLSFRTQPMFLQKGSRLTFPENTPEAGDATFKFSYFELPLLASYSFDFDSDLTPYILVGPTLGFLIDATIDHEEIGEVDQKDQTESIDLGVGVGGGVSMTQGGITLFVEGRLTPGIVNINAEADGSIKNRGFQFLFGFTIPIPIGTSTN